MPKKTKTPAASGLRAVSEARGQMAHRTVDMTLDRETLASRAQGEERIPFVISTEAPAYQEQFDAMEILDHSPESIDLTRFQRGLPLMAVMRGMGLDDHGHRTGNSVQVGVVEDPSLGADRKLRGWGRFSRSAVAQEIRQDVEDGIRSFVSPGYVVRKVRKMGAEGGRQVYRVLNWMPYEVTIVPAPADIAAGVGRSAGGDAPAVEFEDPEAGSPNAAPKAEELTVSEINTAATGDGATNGAQVAVRSVQVGADRRDDGAEMKDLAALAEMHALDHVFSAGVRDGKDSAAIRGDMVRAIRERVKDGPQFQAPVTLTPKEEQRYSITRALMSSAYGTPSFERDIHEQISKNLPEGYKNQGGFFWPTNMRHFAPRGHNPLLPHLQTRDGLDSATSTAGTEFVFDVPGSFIDMLRNKSRVIQLGATVLSGLSSPVTFAKQTGAGTASWVAENPTADVSVSAIATGTVTLTPKTLQSQTKFSKQLLKQQSYDVENIVRNDLAAIHALAIDLAAIAGTGSSNQPTGIITNTSVNSVTVGTNGGVPTYALLVDMETAVEDDNADLGSMGYLTTPGIKGKLKKTEVFATTNGQPVWTGGQEGTVNGYKAYSSNQVPKNLTKGTSTTVCHAILFGSWPQLLIGEWGAAEFLTDPYTLAGSGMIRVVTFQMADIALRYAEAFCTIEDAKTA